MTGTEEKRRRAWESFYAEEPTDGSSLLLVDTPTLDPVRPPLHPQYKQQRIEWAVAKYEAQCNRLAWLNDDRVPYIDCLSGTEIFAAAFGCEVGYHKKDNPFAIPLVHSVAEAADLKTPSIHAPSLATLFEIADDARSATDPSAPVRLPDIQTPMDIAGIVWDKNDFFLSLVLAPEAVRDLASRAADLLTSFLDEWFARYGSAFVAHFPDYYMPHGVTVSEDEIGAVGPEIFWTLFLPELNQLSERYGGIGVHCCAHARHQWNGIESVNGLMMLNLVQPEEVITESIDCFKTVTPMIPLPPRVVRPERVTDERAWREAWKAAFEVAAGARLVYNIRAESEDEAKAIADGFRKAQTERSATG